MAQAKFVKDMPAENVFEQEGADFRPDSSKYQMVPVNGSRKWRIDVSSGPIRVATADETIAGIAVSEKEKPSKSISFASSGEFFIVGGKASGTTVIVAENQNGSRQDFIQASVKSRKNVTCNVIRLTDALKESSKPLTECASSIARVSTFYDSVANTILTQKQVVEMNMQRNLSDKDKVIQLDDGIIKDLIFQEISSRRLSDADIIYVFTWEIQGSTNILKNTGLALDGRCERHIFRQRTSVVFINSFSFLPIDLTVAHETGHHFGCSHFSLNRPAGFIMNGSGQKGLRMTGDDIELVNRS